MRGWLRPVLEVLDRSPVMVPVFFRDDDGGWDDERLLGLTRLFDRRATMLDVAAIPSAVSEELARALRPLLDAGRVAVHQHGWAHANHQRHGRRSEFGWQRSEGDQLADLTRGRVRLAALFGGRVEPFFTPPWNRCQDTTVALLPRVGLTAISCDVTATVRARPGVALIPVRVDWARCWREGGAEALAAQLALAVEELAWDGPVPDPGPGGAAPANAARRGGGPRAGCPAVGIMLHHQVMGPGELDVLDDLLGTLEDHPSARCIPMGAVAGAAGRPQGAGDTPRGAAMTRPFGGRGGAPACLDPFDN